VTLALHRLLLAILHRVFGPPDLVAWRELFTKGAFDAIALRAYFDAHEQSFDLLHPERPFYQTRGLASLYEPDGIGRLIFDRSSYGAALNVFQHRSDEARDTDTLSLAEGARAVVALQGFVPGGLVKKKDEPGSATAGPLNRGAFVLVRGANVFETLMLNLLVYDPDADRPVVGKRSEDKPSWEQLPLPRPLGSKEPSRRPKGWIDWLTWQSRRVELALSPDRTRVLGVVFCVGQGMQDEGLTDPMLPYRADKTRGLVAIDVSEDRALWRDAHALVRTTGADHARAPAAITQIASGEVRSLFRGRPALVIEVFGMRGDQAAIKLARHEQLTLPRGILDSEDLRGLVGEATKIAEDVGVRLRFAVRDAVEASLSPGDRTPDKDDITNITNAIGGERHYYATLAIPFERLLAALPERGEPALGDFALTVKRTAIDSLNVATTALGNRAANMQGAAIAERSLRRALRELLPNQGGTA
jgi:CRISPR system Cascade subunit CasA